MALGTLLIRADANVAIGTGHVMRCLALAQAWQDAGGNVVFAMSEVIPTIKARLLAENCEFIHVSGEIGSQSDCKYTQEIARQYLAEWIVLDGYQFDSKYQEQIKAGGFKLLLVDDVGGRGVNFADIILNQNLHAKELIYSKRQPGAICLLGPRFALLRREFRTARGESRELSEVATRVLVTIGGTDPENATEKVMNTISSLALNSLHVIVVLGPGNAHTDVSKIPSEIAEIKVVRNANSLVELMQWADVAVSAAGSTIWELCWLGVPSVLISTAENQIPGARELAHRGVSVYLGRSHDILWPELAQEVRDLLLSRERRESMSQAARTLVDGYGATRVANALRGFDMTLRRVTREDSVLLWRWANDPEVRAASFQSDVIPQAEHSRWFEAKLNSANTTIYVAEDSSGTAIGQFRVEWSKDDDAEVSVSIAPGRRGSGIASALIRKATELVARDAGLRQLHAYIKPENRASIRAFEKAGFSGFETVAKGIHCCMNTRNT